MVTANQEQEKQVAVERIVGFAEYFGEEHLILACHAAFPLMLTPDLLYQIWASFVPEAPWTAVARVLLSRLCKQVGYESYEMDIEVRNLLLRELKESHGKGRLEELGAFLLEYVQQRLIEDDADTQNLREAQEWTALAYTKPDEAASKLAEALSERVKKEDIGEVLRLSSLIESWAEPLLEAGFEPLLVYSKGLTTFVKGDQETATNSFTKLLKQNSSPITIAGVTVNVPKEFSALSSGNKQQKSLATEETLDLDFYVERPPIEELCYQEILKPGALLLIKGAHQMGKTFLLRKILIYAETQGYTTVFINFQLAETSVFDDLETVLKWFCIYVTEELQLSNQLDDYWKKFFSSSSNCTSYFEEYILNQINTPLVLCLDEFGILFNYADIAQDFVSLLRSWFQKANDLERWEKLRLVLSYSTEMYLPLKNINYSPLVNVGFLISLPEFTFEQVKNLVIKYNINFKDSQIEQVMDMVGGHPYLIQEALKSISYGNITLEQLLKEAPTDHGIYNSHLQQQFFTLHQNPELLKAFKQVISNEEAIKVEPILEYKLEALGLVKREGNKIIVRNNLYRLFFLDKFSSDLSHSQNTIDYTELEKLLIANRWKEADEETAELMFQIASREEEGELRLEDIENFSYADLQIIDQLWLKYSNGHFGLSVQKQIWQELGEQINIETERKLGERTGWFNLQEGWLDYDDYTFSLDAPKGHLPASWDCWGIDNEEVETTCLLLSKYSKFLQVKLLSEKEIDYTNLQNLLAEGKWKEADQETARLMFQIANREEEGWLRVEDIEQFPSKDLQKIDQLWVNASKGHFGFSVQKQIYQSLGGTKEFNQEITRNFWQKVGLIVNNEPYWSQYDNLSFNLSAPRGHLPIRYDIQTPSGVLGVIEGLLSRPDLVLPQVETKQSEKLPSFSFQTITINPQGKIIKTQTKEAKYFTEILPNHVLLEMVAIPGGAFTMGSPEGEGHKREKPQHNVNIKSFFIGKYPVTQAQWEAVMNSNPSEMRGHNRPVENINWYEAVEFCDRLSELTGKKYRLPSEAEWEYACRAGTTTPFSFGETLNPDLATYGSNRSSWESIEYDSNSKNPISRPKIFNNFGLCDMHGTVWEWCADPWHNNYENAPLDGSIWTDENYEPKSFVYPMVRGSGSWGKSNKSRFVVRGGSWGKPLEACRSASRNSEHQDYRSIYNGFRVVCEAYQLENFTEKNLDKLLDEIAPENLEIFETIIKNNIENLLINKVVTSPEIPEGNNEASILSVNEAYDIELEFESSEDYQNSLFLVRFTLKVECYLSYSLDKADYYGMDDDRAARISISDLNKHYFDAEEEYQIKVKGLMSVKRDSEELESLLLSDGELLEFLEDTDISIDSITNIEVTS